MDRAAGRQPQQYLSQVEAAELLGVTTRTLTNWHKSGRLRGWRPGGATHGKLLYAPEQLRPQTATTESR